jgi:acyl-CoA thioester hydrolase
MAELRHRIRVRYSDCDPQGVVFNANYLTYFDIAITELWREALGPYDEVMAAHDVDMVVAEATVRYRAPIRFDEEVDLVAVVSRLGNTSMVTALSIESAAGSAAEGELRHVFVRPGTAETIPIPEPIRAALDRYVAEG